MKVKVLCVTPPEKFFKWADRNGTPFSSIHVVAPDDTAVKKKRVAFLSFSLFTRFARTLTDKHEVFLFAPYHEVLQYSTSLNFLDIKVDGFNFEPRKRLYFPKAMVDFKFERDVTYPVLFEEHVEKGSMLTHFMTYIYTLDSKTQQKPVTFTVCRWMKGKTDIQELFAKLKKLDNPLKQKALENLQNILELPIAQRVRSALQEVKHIDDVDLIAKHHAVEPYEIRYILNKAEYTKKKIDEDIQVS